MKCSAQSALVLALSAVFVLLLTCQLGVGQRTCTQSQLNYQQQPYTVYRRTSYYYTYGCGWWGRRCGATSYGSESYTAYHIVGVYSTVCCPGYTNPGCTAYCSQGCYNFGTCVTPGNCSCTNGWSGTSCSIDIDECALDLDVCHDNATCVNTLGSYTCICDTGFQGDGYNCEDECAQNNGGCHHNCHNEFGSYYCSCNDGYAVSSDGHTCEIPPPPPTNVQVSFIGKRTAGVEWEAPVIDFLNSLTNVSSYQLVATQEQFNISDIVVDLDGSTTCYDVSDTLEENTLYSCTVRAKNTFGLGDMSLPVEFSTLQDGGGDSGSGSGGGGGCEGGGSGGCSANAGLNSNGRISCNLFRAICTVESRGNVSAVGDTGSSIGPYQIMNSYWSDAVKQDPSLTANGQTYQNCSGTGSFAYSERVMQAYMRRYATCSKLKRQPTDEDIARIHNGGPKGWENHKTHAYWNLVRQYL